MTLHVALDFRFLRHNGAIYTEMAFAYTYWAEYLELFERVRPIARVRDVAVLPEGCRRADGAGVEFAPVTNYVGLWSMLKRTPRVLADCWQAVRASEALLLRWGLVGVICGCFARLLRKPYAFEFVGDASAGVRPVRNIQILGFNHLLAEITQVLGRWCARGACCTSYVSRFTQSLYPSRNPQREWVFSGVQLGNGSITAARPPARFRRDRPRIISVGRLEPEKGHAVMLEALGQLRRAGLAFDATVVGPGRELDHLRRQARDLGLADVVHFAGRVEAGPPLWALLDEADLFVIPSLTEGMARALIEALARGLPAVGTAVGGNVELLAPDQLAPPNDPPGLAERIRFALADPERLAEMSRRAFERAAEYHPDEMRRRKHAFWSCLKAAVDRPREAR